ncbi:snaclec rhinocetin subunit beta-like [Magallana gigas]|uniref:snaclec rhinocetin subunit beta-like n=1 Tax=Magallana gigas TaxID=29159 RepID=UPI00334038D8
MPVFWIHCRLCTFGLFFIAFSGLVSGSSNHSFVKDVAFNERLPINSAVYYMEANDGTVSRSHCGARCSSKGSKCAGLLYNHLTRTCHVLKSRLYERSVDKTIVKAGWELFITSQNACDQGWHLYGGHCYLYRETGMSWTDAKRDCQIRNGHLVIIETEEENTWLKEAFLPLLEHDICNLWIGASDEYQDGVFRWLNNKTMIPGLWNLGDPTNFASEGGVMLCTNGLWIDGGYSDTNNFVCEKEL